MNVVLIDSHCHLDADAFDGDRAEIIARAQATGVIAQVIPAVTAAKWPKLRTICTQTSGLYPAYGLHPMFLSEHHPTHLHVLREWLERERPCAIGECGLDFYVEGLNREIQHTYFISQLMLARVRIAGDRACSACSRTGHCNDQDSRNAAWCRT